MELFNFTWIQLSYISLLFIGNLVQVTPQFVRVCNAPGTTLGYMIGGQPYCQHACGGNTIFQCNDAGNCICNSPCVNGAPPALPLPTAQDICPRNVGPVDLMAFRMLLRCIPACRAECTGATFSICGLDQPLPGNMFGVICVCACPAKVCLSTTTTTTSAPLVIVPQPQLLIPPVLKLKKKLRKIWFIAKKLYIIGWAIMKVCAVSILALVYYLTMLSLMLFGIDVGFVSVMLTLSRLPVRLTQSIVGLIIYFNSIVGYYLPFAALR